MLARTVGIDGWSSRSWTQKGFIYGDIKKDTSLSPPCVTRWHASNKISQLGIS